MLIWATIKSCSSFAICSSNFFKNREGWRGWENWLTVDIARQINSDNIIPFAKYSECDSDINGLMDLLVKTKHYFIAVEIKVNYWDDDEITKRYDAKDYISLPSRAVEDINKLKKAGPDVRKLFMMSIVFESGDGINKYRKIFNRNHEVLRDMNWKFFNCGDHNLLLVISDIQRLPVL